jgi:hypothetical protein
MSNGNGSTTVFAPTLPLALSADSALSEDYIPTTEVLVDAGSATPVAVFSATDGVTQALVVSKSQVCQVCQDPETASGWNVVPLFGGVAALEVAAGRQLDGTAHGFYQDGTDLYHATLQADGTWSGPDTLPLCTNLRTAYAPLTAQMLLYGVTAEGDLQVVSQPSVGGPWTAVVCSLDHQLAGASPVLVMLDQQNWVAAAAVQGALTLWQGQVGATQPASPPDTPATPAGCDAVVLGYANAQQAGSAIFLYVDDQGSLNSSVTNTAGAPVLAQIPASQVQQATGLLDTYGFLHVYSVDKAGGLWVLHQTDWVDDGSGNAVPAWAPYIALDTVTGSVAADAYPQDAVSLFALDDVYGALRFYCQDPTTQYWSAISVLQTGDTTAVYPVTRYRTEVTLLDANQTIVPNYAVQVTADSGVGVSVGQATYQIGPGQSASLTTNAFGKITLATLATSVHTPILSFTAEGLSAPPVQPAGAVQSYLAGSGTLSYQPQLPQFSATTLQTATVPLPLGAPPGEQPPPLAPNCQGQNPPVDPQSAAGWITQSMQAGIAAGDIPGLATSPSAGGPLGGHAGFAFNLHDPTRPGVVTFATRDELERYVDGLIRGPAGGLAGSIFSDLEHFFKDIWHGIKTAAIAVTGLVVNVLDKTVTFFAQINADVQQFFQDVKIGLEEAASLVHNVFEAVGAAVEKVLDWLKALFDWKNIWDTKLALESALNQLGPSLQGLIQDQARSLVQGFFAGLEGQVKTSFGTAIASFPDGTSLQAMISQAGGNGALVGARRLPGRAAAPLLASATGTTIDPNAFTSNAHHNSILDKILSYVDAGPDLPVIDAFGQPVADLVQALTDAAQDFNDAVSQLQGDFLASVAHPQDFVQLQVVTLLNLLQDACLAALAFADGVVTAFLDLASAVVGELGALWSADFQIPFLSSLLDFLHDLIDPSGPAWTITAGGLVCLIAAVPITLIYEILHGAAPFPGGTLPPPGANAGSPAGDESAASTACKFVGVGIQAMWALWDTVTDCFSNDPPLVAKQMEKIISLVGIAFCSIEQVFTWPTDEGIPFSAVTPHTSGAWAQVGNWASYWTFPLLDIGLLCGPRNPNVSGWEGYLARYNDPIGKIATSALGALSFGTGIMESVMNHEDAGDWVSNTLGPLPWAFQFLLLDSVVESSDGVTYPVKLLIDWFTGQGCTVGMALA